MLNMFKHYRTHSQYTIASVLVRHLFPQKRPIFHQKRPVCNQNSHIFHCNHVPLCKPSHSCALVRGYIHIYAYTFIYIYIHTYIYAHIYIHTYTYTHTYIYAYIYVQTYIIYTYTHFPEQSVDTNTHYLCTLLVWERDKHTSSNTQYLSHTNRETNTHYQIHSERWGAGVETHFQEI